MSEKGNRVKPVSNESYSCSKCGRQHKADSAEFRTVYGDITVGLTGGIVGGNIDEEGVLFRSMVYCTECLVKVIKLETRLER